MPTANCSRPDDTNWTGAKIKSCYRLASLFDVPLLQAAQNVVPVAVTAGDKVESLRDLPPCMEPVSIIRVALPRDRPCPLAEA